MPVTTRVAPVEVMPAPAVSTYSPTSLLQNFSSDIWKNVPQENGDPVLGSSFTSEINVKIPYSGQQEKTVNGFLGTMLDAYRKHNHVILRPDDVWFAILIQFNFYVNGHAENMREHFVNHKDKVKLKVELTDLNLPVLMSKMTNLIHESIKDADFRDWVMPNFTTTKDADKVTASIVMMGTVQSYFAYYGSILCGIPSVTLLGEESDWQKILVRIDYLSRFAEKHPELGKWKLVLETIVEKMVQTFRSPDSPDVVRFWQCAVHAYQDDYYEEKHISGWLLAFCFWDAEGRLLAGNFQWEAKAREERSDWGVTSWSFGTLSWDNVPSAYVHVPVHIKLDLDKFVTKAVAGFVGYEVLDSKKIFSITRRGPEGIFIPANKSSMNQNLPKQRFMCCFHFGGKRPKRPNAMDERSTQPSLARDDGKTSSFISDSGKSKHMNQKTTEKGLLRKWTPLCDCESRVAWVNTPEGKKGIATKNPQIAQVSDLTELNESWAYEHGGKKDTLQPITGWWVVRTNEGTYGKDTDVPDAQFDSDAEDYDENLAYKGIPLR